LALVPRSDLTRFYLASLYGHMARHDEARQLWSELLEVKPNFSIEHIKPDFAIPEPCLVRLIHGWNPRGRDRFLTTEGTKSPDFDSVPNVGCWP
jgi:adenylate cyclase